MKDKEIELEYIFGGFYQQQFAVGVNEVTRGLERMPPNRGDEKSPVELVGKNFNDSEARCGYFQVGCCVHLTSTLSLLRKVFVSYLLY